MYQRILRNRPVDTIMVVYGTAITQAVSRRSVASEVRVHTRFSPCGICGIQSGNWGRYSSVHTTPAWLHIPMRN
jgi:hypothetical protein